MPTTGGYCEFLRPEAGRHFELLNPESVLESGKQFIHLVYNLLGADRLHRRVQEGWKQYGQELKMLADRYRDVKEIGQRSLDASPSRGLAARSTAASSFTKGMLGNDPLAANAKVGRNAACPCGSGKKYKKCCGRRAVLPS